MSEIIKRLKIEKVVYKGYGLGFFNSNPVFVMHALPGDVADVEIIRKKKNIVFAKILHLSKKSKFRQKPRCDAFGKCGGCDWLQINYQKQLDFKIETIKEIYRNIELPNKFSVVPSPNQYFYRNKSFLPVSGNSKNPIIGIYARKSHQVIPHKKCFLHPPIFEEILQTIRIYLQAAKVPIYEEKNGKGNLRHIGIRINSKQTETLVILVTKNRKLPFSKQLVKLLTEKFSQITGIIQNINPEITNKILGTDDKILFGIPYLHENFGGKKFKLHYQAFFQINFEVAKAMYEFIKKNVPKNSTVIDAYSGTGTIGIYLSDTVDKVFLMENNRFACDDARENILLNNIKNVQVVEGEVESKIAELLKKEAIDIIIFDPPRKGLDRKIIETVSKAKIKKIIYASCDPITQKRDVELFLEKGYRFSFLQPFDMFPQTFHIENVIILEMK